MPNYNCSYDPEIISGELNTPPSSGPSLSADTIVTFTGVGSVTLRVPDFGDTRNLTKFRVLHRSRQGHLNLRSDQDARQIETMSIVISYTEPDDAETFRTFVLNNLGKYITYKDYEGRNWSVIIINPDEVINHDMTCSKSLRVQMRGALA